ncbi:hypothetical protein PCASD_09663 [Puccinia coronata f. sp. avenae]|uniref:Peroxin-7 n=1 Tax=Puccinia coronata f. sp. avenae TaxID=200324 RepID=A0A2N5STZ9_9BASI|nr:hypothetical protein PCASD_18480 [Puccinia coronata f. sp. avenae]PLW37323.1 hypothetical protein PCASD_09663 [Puccinia coronata f. sp. avenae]
MAKLIQRSSTPGFAGYSCAYSPFYSDKLAVATSANFGLIGNGRLHILLADPTRELRTEKIFDSQDGLYDLAWSEIHENQLVTASGDGSIKLWDIVLNDLPVQAWNEHKREVFCVDWNNLKKHLFVSASWDHLVKIWTPSRPGSIMTIPAHDSCVYSARFSPASGDILATCSSDGSLKTWDTRGPAGVPSVVIPCHTNEVLALDWNKYATHLVATASVDRTIQIHDLRKAAPHTSSTPHHHHHHRPNSCCVETLLGHQYAIRNLAWSPHSATTLASCGYDMTARVWMLPQLSASQENLTLPLPPPHPRPPSAAATPHNIAVHNAHKEFVFGLAWSFYHPGVLATASWDQEVHLWSA